MEVIAQSNTARDGAESETVSSTVATARYHVEEVNVESADDGVSVMDDDTSIGSSIVSSRSARKGVFEKVFNGRTGRRKKVVERMKGKK
jgi:hypothetical protein